MVIEPERVLADGSGSLVQRRSFVVLALEHDDSVSCFERNGITRIHAEEHCHNDHARLLSVVRGTV